MKVSSNFKQALDNLINGWSYYHSSTDVLVCSLSGEKEIRYITGSPSKIVFRLTLSADKHILTIWYDSARWGATNRKDFAMQRFDVGAVKHYMEGGISPEKLNWSSYYTAGSWIDSAKGVEKKEEILKQQQTAAVKVTFTTTSVDDNEKKQQQSQIDTRPIEKIWNLTTSEIVPKTAEFYLYAAASGEDKKYEPDYQAYARDFAELLKNYLAMTIGGELRHSRHSSDWLSSFRHNEKTEAWRRWHAIYEANPPVAIRTAAQEFFRKGAWSSAFGGPAWGRAANYLSEFLSGEHSPVMFVDMVIDLEHNTGCIFNKWFGDAGSLKKILDAKFSGKEKDFEILLKNTSGKKGPREAYVESIKSGKKQRALTILYGINPAGITFKPYRQCSKCKTEMFPGEMFCKVCATCPQCKQIVSPMNPSFPESKLHICPSVQMEYPSVEFVR